MWIVIYTSAMMRMGHWWCCQGIDSSYPSKITWTVAIILSRETWWSRHVSIWIWIGRVHSKVSEWWRAGRNGKAPQTLKSNTDKNTKAITKATSNNDSNSKQQTATATANSKQQQQQQTATATLPPLPAIGMNLARIVTKTWCCSLLRAFQKNIKGLHRERRVPVS